MKYIINNRWSTEPKHRLAHWNLFGVYKYALTPAVTGLKFSFFGLDIISFFRKNKDIYFLNEGNTYFWISKKGIIYIDGIPTTNPELIGLAFLDMAEKLQNAQLK